MSRFSFLSLLPVCLIIAGCVTTPRVQTIDKMFEADKVSKTELDQIAQDITANTQSGVMILVKFRLTLPFTASQQLAETQGNTVKDYLVAHGVKVPIEVHLTPDNIIPNQIWIRYRALPATKTDTKAMMQKETYGPFLPLRKPEMQGPQRPVQGPQLPKPPAQKSAAVST